MSKSKIGSVIYCLLSFILAICIFVLTVVSVVSVTVLSPDYLMENMNSSHYFVDKSDEINQSLTDLTYASGLNEKFFDGFVDESMIYDDTEAYLKSYFSGESNAIDTKAFKQKLNSSLDEYIKKNSIKSVDSKSKENLVKEAARIYKRSLEIPLFNTMATYILTAKKMSPFLMIGFSLAIAAICVVFVLTNKWKHKALRYICYATSASFLTVGTIPAIILISNQVAKINLASRALYHLFIQLANNILIVLIIFAVSYLIISVGLFFWHKKLRTEARK